MKPQCQLCLGDFTSLLSQPSSPVVPRCGHVICSDCLNTRMKGKPCYLRCGVVKVKEVHPVRLKYMDTELPNWKEILDSKSYKRLQELNLILDERAAALDEERDILAKALRDYSAGMILEQALRELGAELTALDVQNGALHQQIIQETQRLSELEQKIARVCIRAGSWKRDGREDKTVADT